MAAQEDGGYQTVEQSDEEASHNEDDDSSDDVFARRESRVDEFLNDNVKLAERLGYFGCRCL